ncbi:MAG: hypothetical protein CL573_05480 [Alphaproteobacteria bacterium]|nr:hypothetical protein [Alphaproteobacteria bacterium]
MKLLAPAATMLLLGAWPFVSFLGTNRDELLIYGSAVVLYAVLYLVLVVFWGFIGRVFGGASHFPAIAHVIGVGSVLLFSYLPLSFLLSRFGIALGTVKIAIWLVLTLIILFIVWRLSRVSATRVVLLAAAFVMTAVPVFNLILFVARNDGVQTVAASPIEDQTRAAQMPNVYWFVFDAYAREDVLADYFGFDNSAFVDALENRGFNVADQAWSNYASTKFSISSTVSMDYYLPIGEPLYPALWTDKLQGFNPVVERFRQLGYRYLHAEPGGNNLKTRCGGSEDTCITAAPTGAIGVSEAEVGLLRLTPAFPIIRRLFPNLLSFDFTKISDVIPKLQPRSDVPLFLFAHLLTPHPPQRFLADCSRVENIAFDLAGDDYTRERDSYVNDLRCLNPLILSAVDTILKNDPDEPIIILQSDHGIRGDWSRSVKGRTPRTPPSLAAYANLHAMRTPAACDSDHGESFSPVNTFRIVFGCIQRETPDLLPTRRFTKVRNILDEISDGLSVR